jgi:hypothetical protein
MSVADVASREPRVHPLAQRVHRQRRVAAPVPARGRQRPPAAVREAGGDRGLLLPDRRDERVIDGQRRFALELWL